MIAASRLCVVVTFVSACTSTPPPVAPRGHQTIAPDPTLVPRLETERAAERGIASIFGIETSVRCPAVTAQPRPGDVVTCSAEFGPETYRARLRFADRGLEAVTMLGSDRILISVRMLESQLGQQLKCPNPTFLRVTLTKPGFCKLSDGEGYVRVQIDDLESERLLNGHVRAPETAIRDYLAGLKLEASVRCNEVPLIDEAPGTCEVTTSTGETFQVTFKLGNRHYFTVRDGSKVVILPASVHRQDTGERVPLACPRRVVRPDEYVRCSTSPGGTPISIEVAIGSDGVPRLR